MRKQTSSQHPHASRALSISPLRWLNPPSPTHPSKMPTKVSCSVPGWSPPSHCVPRGNESLSSPRSISIEHTAVASSRCLVGVSHLCKGKMRSLCRSPRPVPTREQPLPAVLDASCHADDIERDELERGSCGANPSRYSRIVLREHTQHRHLDTYDLSPRDVWTPTTLGLFSDTLYEAGNVSLSLEADTHAMFLQVGQSDSLPSGVDPRT